MMGRYTIDDRSFVEVIAGEYGQVKGPASTFTPIQVYNARFKKGGTADFSFPASYNTAFLVISGKVSINEQPVNADHFVLFGNEGEEIRLTAEEDAIVLILSGEPINEPIAAYGPFLMNTWEEVDEAIRDATQGKYGVLE
jgi:redox-sensitive bicupin YhaK (pirin superfamily)